MLPKHPLSLITLCAAAAATQSGSLLAVLQENGFTKYAERLQALNSPVLNAGPNVVVYVPTNAAITTTGNSTITRRTSDEDEKDGMLYAVNEIAPRRVRNSTEGAKMLRTRDLGCTPGLLYQSWLNNPKLVNLGPGRNQTLIEKFISSAARPLVFTGLGESVKVTSDDIPFNGGVIRPISGTLALPRKVSETLPILGAETFLAALQNAGLLADVDNRASITVFAPSDSAVRKAGSLTAAQLRQHIVVDFPAYTTWITNGDVFRTLGGGSVTASVQDGVIRINGARIMASDAIIKNGVAHTIDKVLTASTPTTTSPPSTVPTAAASTAKPPSWHHLALTLVAMAVAAATGLGH
ncbi:hypothetical protein MAPG_10981 [Magnaporthiopsis poae ATCC 64411]|uniref:FAS1 domain-containing protein n=1 Tax=Magnaporthiopsis poae (strain ATCC 64411 / 73-15) TaxID=644358 RepID=A0A0C4EE17_MAGP6|nr:hypothetical protein MAPG_10981 [Magnaporthiopsis poae ATCC 64411]